MTQSLASPDPLLVTIVLATLAIGLPILFVLAIRFLWDRNLNLGRSKELEKLIWQLHRIASAMEHQMSLSFPPFRRARKKLAISPFSSRFLLNRRLPQLRSQHPARRLPPQIQPFNRLRLPRQLRRSLPLLSSCCEILLPRSRGLASTPCSIYSFRMEGSSGQKAWSVPNPC